MLILRNPTLASSIADPDLRNIIEQRFADMCSEDDCEPELESELEPETEPDFECGLQVIVVEPGDSVQALESESGCPILHNLCNDIRFGEPGFTPCFELLEEHVNFYELVFVPGDGDSGINIFIPKSGGGGAGIDAELLAMCAMYSVLAPELIVP